MESLVFPFLKDSFVNYIMDENKEVLHTCSTCNGSGREYYVRMTFCNYCAGTNMEHMCPVCDGEQVCETTDWRECSDCRKS